MHDEHQSPALRQAQKCGGVKLSIRVTLPLNNWIDLQLQYTLKKITHYHNYEGQTGRLHCNKRGRRSRDHMVVGFTTNYVISAYLHELCKF